MQYLLVLLMGIGPRPNQSEHFARIFFNYCWEREVPFSFQGEVLGIISLLQRLNECEPEVKQLSTQENTRSRNEDKKEKARKF